MKKTTEINISIQFTRKASASIIANSLDPDNKDFPEGLIMNQKVNGNKLELYFESSSALESLLNTVDEVLSMIDMTNKTLDKVK